MPDLTLTASRTYLLNLTLTTFLHDLPTMVEQATANQAIHKTLKLFHGASIAPRE